MKIWVDELPKDCGQCPCFEKHLAHCNFTNKCVIDEYVDDIRPTDCPLQSMADHDAELFQNAIVPKFKVGQTVYGIRFTLAYEDVVEFNVEKIIIDNDTITYKGYYDENFAQRWLFATREEAEQKLKEIEGEN